MPQGPSLAPREGGGGGGGGSYTVPCYMDDSPTLGRVVGGAKLPEEG